jgi:glycoside/pentoside/hexuronide:cation symporter, GPH family
MKFGSGVAAAVMLLVPSAYSYNGKVAETILGVMNGIKMNMSLVPTFYIIVAIGIMFLYPLSKQKMLEIEAELKARREKE